MDEHMHMYSEMVYCGFYMKYDAEEYGRGVYCGLSIEYDEETYCMVEGHLEVGHIFVKGHVVEGQMEVRHVSYTGRGVGMRPN